MTTKQAHVMEEIAGAAPLPESDDARVERRLRDLVHAWGLSRFSEEMAWRWLVKALGSASSDNQPDGDALARVRQWVLMQLNERRRPVGTPKWQIGCPDVVPLLRACPLWDCAEFPWVQTLEQAFPVIKAELLALKGHKGFQPYRAPSWASNISAKDGLGSQGHDAGDWNVFYLFLHNVDFTANRALCPATVSIIESIGVHYDHAFFSALAPSTHIKQHHGPTNKKLRCHLPLVVPEGKCRLRVGDETIHVAEGKCFVFDDSFEHEAWNDDDAHARIVLIVDVWHPDFSPQEKKFLSFVRNSQLRMDKKHAAGDTTENFFSIIEEAGQANMSAQEAIWS